MLGEIQEFYNLVFSELKSYLILNSIYKPYIFKDEPEDKLFPVVVVENITKRKEYTTLNYSEPKYSFALNINVYAIDKDNTSAQIMCDELSNLIEKFFTETYRMNIRVSPNSPNIDENVKRTIIEVNCTLDTKFGDKLVIYPY